jgi:hypothetical protein
LQYKHNNSAPNKVLETKKPVNTNKSGCSIQYRFIRKPDKFVVKKIEISQEEKKAISDLVRFWLVVTSPNSD